MEKEQKGWKNLFGLARNRVPEKEVTEMPSENLDDEEK